MGNRRKPKALQLWEDSTDKTNYNPLESSMNITVTNIFPDENLKGKALNLWKQLVPGLCKIGLLGAQDKITLDPTFALLAEFYNIQDELTKARDSKDADRADKIEKLNNQLVRTSRQLSSYISKLGFSPSDRTYFNSVDGKEDGEDLIKDIIDGN